MRSTIFQIAVSCLLLLLANAALAVEYVDLATEEGPHATIQKNSAMNFLGGVEGSCF